MFKVSPNIDTIVCQKVDRITIIGAGQVAKSILLAASLRGWETGFRVVARSNKRAELMRCFLNDLPHLDVEIIVTERVPDLAGDLVVLAIGARTSIRSRRSSKEKLYDSNMKLVGGILPQISESRVVVVTNPSTLITLDLVSRGIEAYGVGVGNDQLRFSHQNGNVDGDLNLIGGHNFYDLVVGANGSHSENRGFLHLDYKGIVERQDALKRSKLFDYRWRELAETNEAFPREYRWYARQRIHSKYHATAVSCALSVLNTISMLTDTEDCDSVVTLELPINIPNVVDECVIAWPINSSSRAPLELTFDKRSFDKLAVVSKKYSLPSTSRTPRTPTEEYQRSFQFTMPFEATVEMRWEASKVYKFFDSHLKFLLSVSKTRGRDVLPKAIIEVMANREFFDLEVSNTPAEAWKTSPQHRGSNKLEHTDIRWVKVGDRRAMEFPSGQAVALICDKTRSIQFHCDDEAAAFHEMRRIIRDEIVVPLLVSSDARVFHSAVVRYQGLNIMVIGPSGGGKTTLALALLSDDVASRYSSAERTVAWVRPGKLIAVGIPESITVFPGTLRSLPNFSKLVRNIDVGQDWIRERKIRLQQQEIVRTTGTALMQGPAEIDLVIEVEFVGKEKSGTPKDSMGRSLSLGEALERHDLTEKDTVRTEWLNWFSKTSGRKFYEQLHESPDYNYVRWSDTQELMESVVGIVARKKLGR